MFQNSMCEKPYLPRRRPTLSPPPPLLCACLRLCFSSFSVLSSQPGPSSGAPPSPPLAGRGWLPSLQPGKRGKGASLDAAMTRYRLVMRKDKGGRKWEFFPQVTGAIMENVPTPFPARASPASGFLSQIHSMSQQPSNYSLGP